MTGYLQTVIVDDTDSNIWIMHIYVLDLEKITAHDFLEDMESKEDV